jgi:hypothetical protein
MRTTDRLRLPALAGLAGVTFLTACSDPPPPPPPPPVQVKAPPPPPPPVTPISELMARLNIDSRVNLPEDRAPKNDPERIAVLSLFDAFARGDSARLQGMISTADQYELEKLVKNGDWERSTASITRIDVRCGQAPTNEKCALAVLHVSEEFQPQLWSYTVQPAGSTFEAVATPPNVMNSLSGEDWIAAWYKLWQDDLALASKPDEEIVIVQRDRSEKTDEPEMTETTGQPTMTPGGPGKRKPSDTPIRAPKPGFN